MSKKPINIQAIASELREGSVFFQKQEPAPAKPEQPSEEEKKPDDTVIPRYHDTTIPRHHDTVIPRHHDTTKAPESLPVEPKPREFDDEELIEKVATALKQVGTQPATYRFTQEEKNRLAMVIFNLSSEFRVSENELVRIALNFLLDHLEEGNTPYFRSPFLEVIKRLKKVKR
jgi:hypothetical protein